VAFAVANPLAGPDHEVAGWFHAHLTPAFVSVFARIRRLWFAEWIGIVLCALVLFFCLETMVAFSRD